MNLQTGRDLGIATRGLGQSQLVYGIVLVSAVIVGVFIVWYVFSSFNLGNLATSRPSVLIVGALVFAASGVYLFTRFTLERILILMVLTLPLVSSLVIDVGGSVRINYLFVLLAVFFGLYMRRLGISWRGWPMIFLLGFTIYALLSTTYTLFLPEFAAVTNQGFRGAPN